MKSTVEGIIQQNPTELEGIIQINPDFKIVAFNQDAEHITEHRNEDVINSDCSILFAEPEKFLKKLNTVLESGKNLSSHSIEMITRNGSKLSVSGSLVPVTSENNKISGALLIFRDRRERQRLYNLLEEKTLDLIIERNKLEAIFNSRMEGTFTIDRDCRITAFNRSAERITGYTAQEALGKKCWDIFSSNYCMNECLTGINRKFADKNPAKIKEIYIIDKAGQRLPLRLMSSPLYNSDGELIGAVETFQDITELKNLSEHLEDKYQLNNIIGRSRSMDKVYRLIENVSKTDSTILITGESGTGKELVARAIHLNSLRRSQPFVAVNCSAFVETLLESELFGHEKGAFTGAIQSKRGRFEMAQGGTLFLDEIGDISPTVQVKLLRVIETRQFERVGSNTPIQMDVRLIVATNKNLSEKLEDDSFREDFYYRINVINIALPPLRDRIEDIPLLLQSFLDKNSKKFNKIISSVSPAAMNYLERYDYPGNIRELENVIEHAFVMCDSGMIGVEHLPEKLIKNQNKVKTSDGITPVESLLSNTEKSHIVEVLQKFNGHRGKTAEALNMDKSTLWRKMKKYELI